MIYGKEFDKGKDLSKMLNINVKYRKNTKSLSDQINLLIKISDTLSEILDLFETD